jgi:hypothetical protein
VTNPLDVPLDTEALMRQATINANLAGAKAFGVGGSSWTVTNSPAGSGVSGPTTTGAGGSVTAYVVREEADKLLQALAGNRAPAGVWKLYAPLTVGGIAQTLQAGMLLTSQATPSYKFAITDLDTDAGLYIGTLEARR